MREALIVVVGAVFVACAASEISRSSPPGGGVIDAGVPDAGNQADETCFTTTRLTALTAMDCISIGYTDGLCPELGTFTLGHVYRCNNVDGEERMPGSVADCTRIGPQAPGTTDWWCEPLVCSMLYGQCEGNGYSFVCPNDSVRGVAIADWSSLPTPCSMTFGGDTICCQDQ